MGYTSRTETYWVDNQLVPVNNYRPSGFGPWPKIPRFSRRDLIVTIAGERGRIVLDLGPMATARRVADSILLHFNVDPASLDRNVWREIPAALIEKIRQRFIDAASRLSERLNQYSNEEAMTGFLFGSAAGVEITEEDWVARLEFTEFSKQRKEGEIGADVAIVINVRTRDGRQAIKTIWLQAKHNEETPSDWRNLPQLESQLKLMREHTESSYGVVYTRRGAIVVNPDSEDEGLHLEELVAEALRCIRGDERPEIFAQSVERLDTFRILLNQQA